MKPFNIEIIQTHLEGGGEASLSTLEGGGEASLSTLEGFYFFSSKKFLIFYVLCFIYFYFIFYFFLEDHLSKRPFELTWSFKELIMPRAGEA